MSSQSTEGRKETDKNQRLLPKHIAIILDGNGRWAKKRFLPRIAGHRAGVKTVHKIVEACAQKNIQALTLFAFSSENWRRPRQEVGLLMDLFVVALERETQSLHKNNVRLQVVGERAAFAKKLQDKIAKGESLTEANNGLQLTVAANYGGRWDITQATRKLAQKALDGELKVCDIDEQALSSCLALHDLPEPDLFIRTGGEQRISNFLLWNLAYTELYFTDVLWPDFNELELETALDSFVSRERRFGRTSDQVQQRA